QFRRIPSKTEEDRHQNRGACRNSPELVHRSPLFLRFFAGGRYRAFQESTATVDSRIPCGLRDIVYKRASHIRPWLASRYECCERAFSVGKESLIIGQRPRSWLLSCSSVSVRRCAANQVLSKLFHLCRRFSHLLSICVPLSWKKTSVILQQQP